MAPRTRFTYRHQYDDEADAKARAATDIIIEEPSMTNQAFTEEVDLNVMVRRFGLTDGAIPPAAIDPKYFGDFSDVPDFRTAWDQVRLAEQRFQELPADLRARFENDPTRLISYLENPDNWEEAVALKLLSKTTPAPEPTPEPPPPPAAS